jgi:hypothetical protein
MSEGAVHATEAAPRARVQYVGPPDDRRPLTRGPRPRRRRVISTAPASLSGGGAVAAGAFGAVVLSAGTKLGGHGGAGPLAELIRAGDP